MYKGPCRRTAIQHHELRQPDKKVRYHYRGCANQTAKVQHWFSAWRNLKTWNSQESLSSEIACFLEPPGSKKTKPRSQKNGFGGTQKWVQKMDPNLGSQDKFTTAGGSTFGSQFWVPRFRVFFVSRANFRAGCARRAGGSFSRLLNRFAPSEIVPVFHLTMESNARSCAEKKMLW